MFCSPRRGDSAISVKNVHGTEARMKFRSVGDAVRRNEIFSAPAEAAAQFLLKNVHGVDARVKFRSVGDDVRRSVFFARDSQHRSTNVHRMVFFAEDDGGGRYRPSWHGMNSHME